MNQPAPQNYEAPRLDVLGDIRALTEGSGLGSDPLAVGSTV